MFDSNIKLSFRGGILMSIANSPESLSQQVLVGIVLVGRLCVEHQAIITGTDVGRYSCGSCALRE